MNPEIEELRSILADYDRDHLKHGLGSIAERKAAKRLFEKCYQVGSMYHDLVITEDQAA